MQNTKILHKKLLDNKFSHKNLPIVILGQADNDRITLMARLLYETGSLPDETIGEVKRISKELGENAGIALIIDMLKKEHGIDRITPVTEVAFLSRKRVYCVYDAPGYTWLVQGMLTGTILNRIVILMIDMTGQVSDRVITGYAQLFKLLCLENMIVLLNNVDRVDDDQTRFQDLKEALCASFSSLSIHPPVYIPVSIQKGDCITQKTPQRRWYKGPCLLEALDSIHQPAAKEKNKPFRFPVQDIYTTDRRTVIAGRIASGSVQKGEKAVIYPIKKEVRITEIKIFRKKNVQRAISGENIGLILNEEVPVKRGDIIACLDSEVIPVTNLDVHIFLTAGARLKTGSRMILHCATQRVACVVEKIENKINTLTLETTGNNKDTMEFNEAGSVNINTEYPLIVEKLSFIEELGRIILEKDNVVIGAGFI